MIRGYTAGAFDLFHIGHLNLIKRAKENCDYLIVGITTDELIEKNKGKTPVIKFEERIEIVKSIKYVDEVCIQDDLNKVKAWEKFHYDILFMGDDWKNCKRFIEYEKELNKNTSITLPIIKEVNFKNYDLMTAIPILPKGSARP